MKIIKEILGRLFAIWALIIFASSLLIVFIPVWISSVMKEPGRTVLIYRILRVWMDFFFVCSGVRRIITGLEYFQKGKAYIVVCNHNSLMDIPLSTPAIPGPNKTIAKIEMTKVPVFGTIYKSGSVLVDRKSEESRRNSYAKMRDVLNMGLHMCIYPEGTRNKSDEPLQRFQDGAFRLSVETGHEIIPAVIFHTKEVLPRKILFFWPAKVEMHFLPPIAPGNKSIKELKEEVFEIMRGEIVRRGGMEK
jgi:1-acyl-sn-glycerol-3-phosphate acyltransferase